MSGQHAITADVVRRLMEFGFTQSQIAGLVGVSRETVSRWSRGVSSMSAEHYYVFRGRLNRLESSEMDWSV